MLDKYGVELIGAKLPSIDRAEDRELFKQAMVRIGLKTPPRWVGWLGEARSWERYRGVRCVWGHLGLTAWVAF